MLLLLAGASFAQQPALTPVECQVSEDDYPRIWEQLRELSRSEGASIGVAAQGRSCQQALDVAIRTGPFPGVQRVEEGTMGQCVATLRPSFDGYVLGTNGECRADTPEGSTLGADRVVTVAWWLPVGAGARWNEDLGGGLSGLVDLAFREPRLDQIDAFGLYVSPPLELASASRQIRLLAGLDVGRRGLNGNYLGMRGGAQWVRPEGTRPGAGAGLMSVVAGHKWVSDGLVTQLGGGFEAGVPLERQRTLAWLFPVLELRVGLGSVD